VKDNGIRKGRNFVSYEEAMSIVIAANLKNRLEFVLWKKTNNISNIPRHP
jgi:hypothetical protein